ncbi:hypothetical protein [Streptomyces coeruleorubidus]|uniref:hypothetical protein n=1 Tax=Streptomyces coeruleorubidus TaxID=116188 RepID=UPI0036517BDA
MEYTVDTTGQPANCELMPADNPTHVELRGTAGGCTIIASQTGDSRWAPAKPVRQDFRVGYQPVTLSWADPRVDMQYPGTLSVRIGIESPDPLDASIEMEANGSCDFDGSDTTYISVDRRTVITATVTARDPGRDGRGECTLSASVVSDHTRANPITPRTYRVLGPAMSGSSAPSPQ